AVVLIHLLLVTVFTPLKPDPVGGTVPRADRTTLYVSSRVMDSEPLFLQMVDTFDPVSFLHPPEEFGFSFFRTSQAETGPDSSFELPLPAKISSVPTAPQISLAAVSRPLLPDVPDYDPEVAAVAAPVYPYWAADTASGVVFPAFRLGSTEERTLQRQRPSEQSVFLIKTPVLPDLPYEAVLEKSCGIAELDMSARAWLDTLLNSSDCPAGLKNCGFCRVVWSAGSLQKEASVR
ncbi:MAG: hypothetical protein ILO68_01390, partial [Clostridia bacterium]|nr:hypothetical protein [Clostridia bacterium]